MYIHILDPNLFRDKSHTDLGQVFHPQVPVALRRETPTQYPTIRALSGVA